MQTLCKQDISACVETEMDKEWESLNHGLQQLIVAEMKKMEEVRTIEMRKIQKSMRAEILEEINRHKVGMKKAMAEKIQADMKRHKQDIQQAMAKNMETMDK